MVAHHFWILLVLFSLLKTHLVSANVDASHYMQWRAQIEYTDSTNLPSCLEHCSSEKCGPTLKGVATCGAMFEFKDEPDPADPEKTLYVHCFCQRSTIAHRTPGKLCGPNGELCKNPPAPDFQPPPDGNWVDGKNTIMDDIQGVEHLANYNSQIKKVCYEKFLDGPVTYEQAKAKCAAMGYILAEIYTPEQLEAFHLVVESAYVHLGLTTSPAPPDCLNLDCLQQHDWFWESTNRKFSEYHLSLFSGGMMANNNRQCMVYKPNFRALDDAKCGSSGPRDKYVCQKPCEP